MPMRMIKAKKYGSVDSTMLCIPDSEIEILFQGGIDYVVLRIKDLSQIWYDNGIIVLRKPILSKILQWTNHKVYEAV